MGALGLLISHSLRTNRRAILGLALVIALAGGVTLTALAGARRTASAFPRYLADSHASDVAINVVAADDSVSGSLDDVLVYADRARQLPEVEADATYIGLESILITDEDDQLSPYGAEVVGSLDGRFIDQDRVAVLEGELPDPDAIDQVLVSSQTAEQLGLHVGSTVGLAVFESVDDDFDPATARVLGREHPRVTGIGQFPDEVLGDDIDRVPRILATPALTARYRDVADSYFWQGLRLTPGTSVDDAISAYRAILDDGYTLNVQRTDVQIDRVQRSLHPIVAALTAFAAAAALATLALGALGALRLMGAAAGQSGPLRAIGLSTAGIGAVATAPALLAITLGALGAAGVAVALSPLGPVGPVRDVEPSPGLALDATVLVLGALAILLLLGGVVTLAARRARWGQRRKRPEAHRPPWLVTRAAIGLGPAAVVGIRHGLGGDTGGNGPPSRSAIAACAVSILALTSALTFGASVRGLIDSPPTYGWAADLAVDSGGGYQDLDLEGASQAAAVPEVDGLTIAGFASLTVSDDHVNAIGIVAVEGPPLVTMIKGRVPATPDEVALGATTSRHLHRGIGEVVDAAGGPLEVVGIVALPAIGPIASAHPSLGQGALMTLDGLSAQSDQAYPSLALVRLRPGTDPAVAAPGVTTALAEALTHIPPEAAESYLDLRPAEVVGLQPASRTANLLAGLLGIAAVLALSFTLSASVRRRAPTYAILHALGFDHADLRRTVRWQTNVVTVSAIAVGLPLGVVVGRTAWTVFTQQLGAAAGPQVPIALLGMACVSIVALANLVGEGPARTAVRHTLLPAREG